METLTIRKDRLIHVSIAIVVFNMLITAIFDQQSFITLILNPSVCLPFMLLFVTIYHLIVGYILHVNRETV